FPAVCFRPHRFHALVESNQQHGITNDSYHSTSLWTDTHIATSIRVETLLEKLAVEGCAAVDQVFPERLGHGQADEAAGQTLPYDFEADSRQIPADSDGYVQYIGGDVLMRIATKNDLVLSIAARPGVFVTQGACVITAYPKARVSDEIDEDLRGAVVIGRDRTPYQDLEFAIRRICQRRSKYAPVGRRKYVPGDVMRRAPIGALLMT
ncbi:DUF2254 family protein, partial [Aurantimonas sp. E1-2-R+4]|uniref:DUF2254 family protein n=1 Tax=Aurantimonas sp. E1-2-R+4 TaxID=3113714 RepID=UPI002F958B9B